MSTKPRRGVWSQEEGATSTVYLDLAFVVTFTRIVLFRFYANRIQKSAFTAYPGRN